MKISLEKIKRMKSTEELLEFGIINIDKSSGPTSFNISDFVRKTLNVRKTSHFGTLDPKVTGVLPLAINRACKLAGYFLGEDKTYVGIMRMHDDISLDKIQEKINEKFIGEIIQMPPVKSAVKRQLRPRTIYEFKVLEKDEKDILFKVSCQGGTYVRTLCVDLGKELGCEAHMLELRRTNAGIFSEDDSNYPSVSLYEFEKAVNEHKEGNSTRLRNMIIPGEIISELYPSIEINKNAVKTIFHGSPIHDDEVQDKKFLEHKIGEKLIAFSEGTFIGIFKVIKEGNLFARSEFTLQPIS
jgi:H/ACA ribonucleoprotein complex subunit 4